MLDRLFLEEQNRQQNYIGTIYFYNLTFNKDNLLSKYIHLEYVYRWRNETRKLISVSILIEFLYSSAHAGVKSYKTEPF